MNYLELKKCRFCDNELFDIIHLGDNFPLAGGFMRHIDEFKDENVFPLTLNFCNRCSLIQCKQIINSDILFKKGYFYYSSMIPMLVKHFENYAYELSTLYEDPKKIKVIEMGCNDGVFLKPLKKYGFDVVGVDPSNTVEVLVKDNYNIYNDYFNENLAKKIVSENGLFDIFLSSNSFAHINDMKSIINGVKTILKPNGLAIIEVHYSKTIIDELQFDFIYHEHMTYYTLSSFYNIAKLYGFSIEDVKFTNIHGKSMRIYLRNTPNIPTSDYINKLIDDEKHLNDINTYKIFNEKLNEWKNNILNILNNYKGKKIYGYGSSGRTNIICSFLNLNLDEIIDDASSKINTYTPIYHNCIKSSNIIVSEPPDLIIILAWPYSEYIVENINKIYNGHYLIPLPNIKLIN